MKFLDILSEAYYRGEPLVSNEYFDELATKYNYQGLGTKSEQEIEHTYRMFSLSKVYPGDKIPFEGGIKTPKLDGAAVEVTYKDGRMLWAATRGDGIRGQDITDKMSRLLPDYIGKLPRGLVQITGEVVTRIGTDNIRNYASGALNLKNIDEFEKRDLTFFAYDMVPSPFEYYLDTLRFIDEDCGIFTVKTAEYDNISVCSQEGKGIWPTDGTVVRLDDNKKYKEMGHTSKHPRGAYALKKNKDGVRTVLRDITWQVGRSGVVSPVAILDSVDIDGAQVSRATLHNWKYIQELNLEKDCIVEVIRAGEIIPRVVRRVDD